MIVRKIKEGCRVGLFGIGKSNLALLGSEIFDNCSITLRSDKLFEGSMIPCGKNIERIFEGNNSCRDIDEDILIFSPSVRRERMELAEARERGVLFSSDAEMFFEENSAPVFSVSGSDGKSSTATLTNMLLSSGGHNSKLIGNIGEPMFTSLGSADCFVAELSSFMLHYYAPKVRRACVTNITPNHLDWHENFEEYRQAKLSLIRSADEFVISAENSDIPGAYSVISDKLSFEDLRKSYLADVYLTLESGEILCNGKRLISVDRMQRRDRHTIRNLMMAVAMTDGFVSADAIETVAESFCGLEHRCEMFFSFGGVNFYDSSIDTTPSRTNSTLLSLGRSCIVILGGRGKGLDYREMLPALSRYAEATVIVGENAEEIYVSLSGEVKCYIAEDFRSAIELGTVLAKKVGALILSPASTSYDAFSDYRERGRKFKEIIYDLHKKENSNERDLS